MTARKEFATVALWATNMAQPLNGIGAWLAKVEEKLAEARAGGADVLVLPEYASEQWLSYAPAGLKPTEEVAWMAEEGRKALEALPALVERSGVALLAGSFPVEAPGRDPDGPPHVNRAHLILPDGRTIAQDKLCLTPGEKSADAWNLNTGSKVELVEWNGLRIASLICLDVELPALAAKIARSEPDLDLLLVPSMTEKQSGYSRVFDCAKARAVELQTAVCAVGCIGSVAPDGSRPNYSGAAVFTPCEAELGFDGRFAAVPGAAETQGDGPMLIARDVPVGMIRQIREGGRAEVWPGSWDADGVAVGG
ncbi:MAG: nitrilase-related carbon-nitrogen hydrolase [Marivibrio sp.]|uniref:nitrilase-related carbon-nitrogen hydrolase n=1 Tax=Marivibrio sp. TaxID=2039719 RepID=UPI0032EACF00